MLITAFTAYSDIREALGVEDDELADETLSAKLYEDALMADLDDVSLDLVTTFQTVNALATPTEAQERFLRYARLFSTYSVARQLLSSLPMFSMKSVEDGKARMERFAEAYRDTIKTVNGEYDKYKNRLSQALASVSITGTATVSRSYMSVVTPVSDPITGT